MPQANDPVGGGQRWEEDSDRSGRIASVLDEHAPSERVVEDRTLLASVVRGASGGLVATVMMTLFRLPVFRALPPTAEFWAQYIGGGPAEEYTVPAFLLHVLYGTTGGAVLGALFPSLDRRSPLGREETALLAGVGYGLALSAFGARVVFRHLLDRELDDEHALVFHVAHVVYGLTLGMWLGERKRRGEAYESPEGEASSETAPAR